MLILVRSCYSCYILKLTLIVKDHSSRITTSKMKCLGHRSSIVTIKRHKNTSSEQTPGLTTGILDGHKNGISISEITQKETILKDCQGSWSKSNIWSHFISTNSIYTYSTILEEVLRSINCNSFIRSMTSLCCYHWTTKVTVKETVPGS